MFTIQNGVVCSDGTDAERLPEQFWQPDFLIAMFRTHPAEPGAARQLCRQLTVQQRQDLGTRCLAHGGELAELWSDAAAKWASVGSETGRWNHTACPLVYRGDVLTYLIDDVGVDRAGRKFTLQRGGASLSFAEFQLRYGITVEAHLLQHVHQIQRNTEYVLSALTGRPVMRDVDLVDQNGNRQSHIIHGLSSVPIADWTLPRGWSLPKESTNAHSPL